MDPEDRYLSQTPSQRNLGYSDPVYDEMCQYCRDCGGWKDTDDPEALCLRCQHGDHYRDLEKQHADFIDQYNHEHGVVYSNGVRA